MWISSVNGGTLVPLTNIPNTEELGGSWSTDGTQFAYLQSDHDAEDLMIVKTTGNAPPRMLKKNTYAALPEWSPTGEWIRYYDKEGWWLISPDGKVSKFLGQIHTKYLAFSKNGRLLYGIDTGDRLGLPDRATLFSLDPATLKRKAIKELGKDLAPRSPDTGGVRFSLAPDGKSFVYSTEDRREDLWMLTGYRQPGWRTRISDLLNLR